MFGKLCKGFCCLLNFFSKSTFPKKKRFQEYCHRLMTFANSLDPDHNQQNHESKPFDTLNVYLKEFFETILEKKVSRRPQKHEKLPSMKRADGNCILYICTTFAEQVAEIKATIVQSYRFHFCLQILERSAVVKCST